MSGATRWKWLAGLAFLAFLAGATLAFDAFDERGSAALAAEHLEEEEVRLAEIRASDDPIELRLQTRTVESRRAIVREKELRIARGYRFGAILVAIGLALGAAAFGLRRRPLSAAG